MVDRDGYRLNVGMVVLNSQAQCWLGKRKLTANYSWQFPQGGIEPGENPEAAMWRELREETGLSREQVRLCAQTHNWLSYDIPARFSSTRMPYIKGQKQLWFLLQLLGHDQQLDFNSAANAEFVASTWASYWYPLGCVVEFKRAVYRQALTELAPAALELGV